MTSALTIRVTMNLCHCALIVLRFDVRDFLIIKQHRPSAQLLGLRSENKMLFLFSISKSLLARWVSSHEFLAYLARLFCKTTNPQEVLAAVYACLYCQTHKAATGKGHETVVTLGTSSSVPSLDDTLFDCFYLQSLA